jgi:type VI secretion system protein ImpC
MTIKSSFGAINLSVNPAADRAAVLDPEAPFRVLLLGDFSGRASQSAKSPSGWKPVEIDCDNFEEVLARMRPEFAGLRFAEMDDFHPDRIYQGPLFQSLRELRRKLETPATFAAAASEIRAWSQQAAAPAPNAPQAPPVVEPERPELTPGVSLLDSIVEAEEPARAAAPIRRNELRSFVDKVVAPYSIPADDPDLPRLLAQVDAESSARMRAILHAPGFQALEAAWRAVFHMVRAVETGSQLKLYLMDVSKAELAADLSATDDLRQTAAWRVLVEETVETGGDAWSVVAGNYTFARTVADAEILGRLAKIMSFAGSPFLAEADPGAAGPDAEQGPLHWERLRRLPEASWIGLAMPRLLLRLPYGGKTVQVESFDFEEMPGVPGHQEYLWGNPAFTCAQILAEQFANEGLQMRPGAHVQIDGLPLHVYKEDGEQRAKPCAEVLLADREIDWILDEGYMPLASVRDTDAVRLVRFQSISKPLSRLSGRWG